MSIFGRPFVMISIGTAVAATLLSGSTAGAAVSQSPDIGIGVTASPAGVFAHTISFIVTVTNNGPGAWPGSTVSSTDFAGDPPEVWASVPAGCADQRLRVLCYTGSLQPGASIQFTINGSASGGGGTWHTQPMTFRVASGDANPANDSASVLCTITGGFIFRC